MLYNKMTEDELIEKVSNDIRDNKVVGWFQGGSEFGPRALGHRSIFANPCWEGAQSHLNDKVKYREYWRPYAPIVATYEASKYFENIETEANSYMLMSYKVKVDTLPGITHEDGSARIQTVSESGYPPDANTRSSSQTMVPPVCNQSVGEFHSSSPRSGS